MKKSGGKKSIEELYQIAVEKKDFFKINEILEARIIRPILKKKDELACEEIAQFIKLLARSKNHNDALDFLKIFLIFVHKRNGSDVLNDFLKFLLMVAIDSDDTVIVKSFVGKLLKAIEINHNLVDVSDFWQELLIQSKKEKRYGFMAYLLLVGAQMLGYVAKRGDVMATMQLLASGVDLDSLYEGKTALHWASELGHIEIVGFLLRVKADPNVTARIKKADCVTDDEAAPSSPVLFSEKSKYLPKASSVSRSGASCSSHSSSSRYASRRRS